MNTGQSSNAWGQIVAKAWADEPFKKRLLADPLAVLKEHNMDVPLGVQVKIVEDTDMVYYLRLPLKPSMEELSEEDLEKVAGGGAKCGKRCTG